MKLGPHFWGPFLFILIVGGAVIGIVASPQKSDDAAKWRDFCTEIQARARVESQHPEALPYKLADSPVQEYAARCR